MPHACTSGVDTGFATLGYFKVAMLGIGTHPVKTAVLGLRCGVG